MENLNEREKDLFTRLSELELWYQRNYITLEEYFKIKSNIIDSFKNKTEEKSEDLPF